jgi:hypothetical protein
MPCPAGKLIVRYRNSGLRQNKVCIAREEALSRNIIHRVGKQFSSLKLTELVRINATYVIDFSVQQKLQASLNKKARGLSLTSMSLVL